jgi:hypothetical protein
MGWATAQPSALAPFHPRVPLCPFPLWALAECHEKRNTSTERRIQSGSKNIPGRVKCFAVDCD